jgi:type VI secretion system protein ImpC
MLMSVQNNIAGGESVVLERPAVGGVYASLFEKINLNPVSELSALDIWQDAQAMSDATADERLTAGMQVFLECLTKAGSKVEKLDKSLIDHHIAELDYQISRQLDAVMHHEEFQAVESLWRGVKSLVDKTDFRQNVKIELLSMSKEELRQDFEDSPEIIQSGLYKHAYIDEYDTPGGEPIAALISAYEFDASAQDVALLRNISKVSAAAHMPFIGSAGPKFFLKESMEDVAAIKDIGNYFDRAEYIKWKSFRDTDDARYIGLVMPRVLGRCRMARIPFRFAASTMSKKSKVRITTNTCGRMRRLPSRPTWCVALSIMAGVYRSVARRPVVRFRICLSICTISVPAIR